ncbi:glycosyltransferase [Gymnodinialimonas sp.]
MKIALITGDLSNKGAGVKEVVEGLSSALAGHGHTVEVFGIATPAWDAGDDKKWTGAKANAFRVMGPTSLGYVPDMAQRLRAFDPDVVHVHGIWQYPSYVALKWHRATDRPLFSSPHGMLHPRALAQASLKKALVRRLYVDALLRASSSVIAATSEEAAHCRDFGVAGAVVEFPNGVILPDTKNVQALDAPWSGALDAQDPVMLFLGRFHPTKNLDTLLDVWKDLHGAGHLQGWQLAIAGWGDDAAEANVRARVDAFTAAGARVAFIGPLFGAAKQAAFHHAAGFILPSLNESFPITPLEAWGARRPTLLSTACNLDFAVSEGAAFEIGTTREALATDLQRFFALGRAEHGAMGQRAFDLVRRDFSWPVVAKMYEDAYEQPRARSRAAGSGSEHATEQNQ